MVKQAITTAMIFGTVAALKYFSKNEDYNWKDQF